MLLWIFLPVYIGVVVLERLLNGRSYDLLFDDLEIRMTSTLSQIEISNSLVYDYVRIANHVVDKASRSVQTLHHNNII